MASIGHIMGTKIETDMRSAMFDHLQKLSFNYFDNTKVGQIMTRITTDLFDVTEFAHHCPEEFFIAGIKIIGSFVILCGVNVWLTLIMFTIVPFIVIAAIYFNRKMKEQFRRQRVQLGEINAQWRTASWGCGWSSPLPTRSWRRRNLKRATSLLQRQAPPLLLHGRVRGLQPAVRRPDEPAGAGGPAPCS